MNTPRHIEIVLDFVCAHSYIGFTRLQAAAARLRSTDTDVHVDISPHQLRPDAPETPEPLFEVHRRDHGEQVARHIAADRNLGAEDGLTFRFDRALFVNTARAHRLIALARQHDLAAPMAEQLFRAYFTDGRNIADPQTLRHLANNLDIEAHQPWPDITSTLDHNRKTGVTDTPVFRLPDGTTLTGQQTNKTLQHAIGTS